MPNEDCDERMRNDDNSSCTDSRRILANRWLRNQRNSSHIADSTVGQYAAIPQAVRIWRAWLRSRGEPILRGTDAGTALARAGDSARDELGPSLNSYEQSYRLVRAAIELPSPQRERPSPRNPYSGLAGSA